MSLKNLFKDNIRVLNIGLEQFNEDLLEQSVSSVQMDWRPREISNDVKNLIDFFDEL